MENKEFYTVKETAKILGMHYNTIYAFVKDGTIKAKKIGKKWVIPKGEIFK